MSQHDHERMLEWKDGKASNVAHQTPEFMEHSPTISRPRVAPHEIHAYECSGVTVAARNADLEAAIAADPVHGPYLVYGDWLQSQGDPRGELIAVQCALETARGPAWAKLKIRERELLLAHGAQLLGPAASPPFWRNFVWRRGFVDRMRAEFVLDEGEQLIAHPSLAFVRAVANVELSYIRDRALPLLNELAVHSFEPRELLALSTLRHLKLGDLRLSESDTALSDAVREECGLETFTFEGDAEKLRELSWCRFPDLRILRATSWTEGAAAAIAAFLGSAPQATLDLELDVGYDDPGFHAAILDDASMRRRIHALRLPDDDLDLLGRVRTRLRRLRALQIGDCVWSTELVAALPIAPRLSRLVLDCEIANPDVVAALATSPYAQTVETLTLELRDGVASKGLRRGVFGAVRSLDISLPMSKHGEEAADLREAFPCVEHLVVDRYALGHLEDFTRAIPLRTLTLKSSVGAPDVDRHFARDIARLGSLQVVRLFGDPLLTPEQLEILGALPVAVELMPPAGPIRTGSA